VARATESTSPDATLSSHLVEIGSGLYAGVVQHLGEGRHVIGSDDGADLVLLEPDLAPRHAALILRGATAQVEALADGVSVTGLGPVPSASTVTIRLPATVTIGGVEMVWRERKPRLAGPASGARERLLRLSRSSVVPGLAAAALLSIAVVMTMPSPIADAAVPATATVTNPILPIPPAAPVRPKAASLPKPVAISTPVALGVAIADLRRQVEEAGLHSVRIEAGSGTVTATGSVEPALATRWEALQRAFDERVLGEVTLVNSVAVRTERQPVSLSIEGFWQGAQPYIVLRGQRYFVGALVEGGWAIRAIDQDRVMLERDGRLVAMRF